MNKYIDTKTTDKVDAAEPVTLADMKTWMLVTTTDFDDIITDLITIARKKVERTTHLSLVAKDVVLTVDMECKCILPYPKIEAITKVEYLRGIDAGVNDWVEILAADNGFQLIGEDIKEFYSQYEAVHRIAYSTLPFTNKEIIHDVKRVCNWLFRNRGDEPDLMPVELMSNAKQYKIMTWG